MSNSSNAVEPWHYPKESWVTPFNWSPESDLVVFRSHNDTRQLNSVLRIDLVESENDFHVHADLPGVNENELEISIEHNNLVIRAQREHKYDVESSTAHRMERTYGKVQRSIHLPPNADQSKVVATFENGVLTVTFPKTEPSSPRTKVPVNYKG